MYQTTYHRPTSLAEAARLFSEAGDAAYVSGGHTLIPAMKLRLSAAANLIDLRHVGELKGISVTADEVAIGAGMTHAEVAGAAEVKGAIPALAGLAGSIGDAQVRHLGTIGGSVANNDPAADYPSAVLALAGTVETDRRAIAADDYFVGLYETALEEGEIVTRVRFRVPEAAGYAKFRNPASRYPMAGVFVARHGDGSVRVAVTGAGNSGVFRAAEMERALAADFSADALKGIALDPADMMGDIHGSAEYRAHLVTVMARRAVQNLGQALAFV
ncbi:FAD binding domain-containing protein [Propylenella binzhouense]|uniref:Xanthine dehydrogenase family protein subunit M n=1 Tax=Propylenella binzhouense TaxID=2555902 RepID=A0A964T7L8_9HYPH|nr:xanthine dehydrogenase family protein subunit M [Propylenella binzhouense]MYZ50036.1 xanthine dehydrogenase family protein subunit M [Propylenella binzhouense]